MTVVVVVGSCGSLIKWKLAFVFIYDEYAVEKALQWICSIYKSPQDGNESPGKHIVFQAFK